MIKWTGDLEKLERAARLATLCIKVFENSSTAIKYDALVTLKDAPGGVKQITYGFSQFTHASGSLLAVVDTYLRSGPNLAFDSVRETLKGKRGKLAIQARDAYVSAAHDDGLKRALQSAALDPAMRLAQVSVYLKMYLLPSIEAMDGSNWVEPLSLVAVLDGKVHGAFARIRDRVRASLPERDFVTSYLRLRNRWLKEHSSELLRNTASRSGALLKLAEAGNWGLETPFTLDLGHRGKFVIAEKDLETVALPSLSNFVSAP